MLKTWAIGFKHKGKFIKMFQSRCHKGLSIVKREYKRFYRFVGDDVEIIRIK